MDGYKHEVRRPGGNQLKGQVLQAGEGSVLSLPFLKQTQQWEHAVKPSGSARGGICSAALTSLGQQRTQSSESPLLFRSDLRSEGKAYGGNFWESFPPDEKKANSTAGFLPGHWK